MQVNWSFVPISTTLAPRGLLRIGHLQHKPLLLMKDGNWIGLDCILIRRNVCITQSKHTIICSVVNVGTYRSNRKIGVSIDKWMIRSFARNPRLAIRELFLLLMNDSWSIFKGRNESLERLDDGLTWAEIPIIRATIIQTETSMVTVTRKWAGIHRMIGKYILNHTSTVPVFTAESLGRTEVCRGTNQMIHQGSKKSKQE